MNRTMCIITTAWWMLIYGLDGAIKHAKKVKWRLEQGQLWLESLKET